MALPSFADVFQIDSQTMLPGVAWSDNSYAVATSIDVAARYLSEWRLCLSAIFNMNIKVDSLTIVPARCKKVGTSYLTVSDMRFGVVDSCKSLGSVFTSTREDVSEHNALHNSWNRAFGRPRAS